MNAVEKTLAGLLWLVIAASSEAGLNARAKFDLIDTSFGSETTVREDYEFYEPIANLVNPDPAAPSVPELTPEQARDLLAEIQDKASEVPYTPPVEDKNFAQRHPWWTTGGVVAALVGVGSYGKDKLGWFSKSDKDSEEEKRNQGSNDQVADGQGVAAHTEGDNSPVTVTIVNN